MTSTVATMLAQKQELLDRREQNPGSNERLELEQMLSRIDTALNLLDSAGADDLPQ